MFKKKLSIFLIRPSKYDDDGYVIRHWKGILPSNTLACLYGLTLDVCARKDLGEDLNWHIEIIDETVQKINVQKIIKESKDKNNKVLVCLVGVQSNQFPRASDLALEFREKKIDVLIGGFHVSGSLAMFSEPSPEIKKLLDAGVTVIAGEIEGRWGNILQDALNNNLKSVYNFLATPSDIQSAPMPHIDKKYMKRFISSNFCTLDCGRGCPFNCSFCSVVNVHGRKMRFRNPDKIIELIKKNYIKYKISFYFFTDDNFSRNKNWEELFSKLTKLRSNEQIPVEFMIQVDTQSHKIPNFVKKAAQAGCEHVFIGMESLNPDNLERAGKKQNNVNEFKELVEIYRSYGIDTHVAYMIGLPSDTPESVRKDIEKLKEDIGPDQASFFIITPLPGSRDHHTLKLNQEEFDSDFNNYDSFHVTIPHLKMSKEDIIEAYKYAWSSFYSLDNMEAVLNRVSKKNYWDVFMKFVFYKNAVFVENEHPMLSGIFRIKDRKHRRPGCKIDSLFEHSKKVLSELLIKFKQWNQLFLEMEELWLRTRPRTLLEQYVVKELGKRYTHARQWRDLKVNELKSIYFCAMDNVLNSLGKHKSSVNISNIQLWLKKHNLFSTSLTYSRNFFKNFWDETCKNLKRGKLYKVNFVKMSSTVIEESYLFASFISSLLIWLIPHLFRGVFSFARDNVSLNS